jgi:hypothetical protein
MEEEKIQRSFLMVNPTTQDQQEEPIKRWKLVVQRDALQILGIRGWRRRAGEREELRRPLREARA